MNQRLNKPHWAFETKTSKRKKEEAVAVTFCSSHLNARQSQWTALCRFWALITMAMALCHPTSPLRGQGCMLPSKAEPENTTGKKDAPTGACHDVILPTCTSPRGSSPKLPQHFPSESRKNNSATNKNWVEVGWGVCVSLITSERAENRTNGLC